MKLENPSTCEDCLSFLVESGKMEIVDRTILRSIDRQISRKTAMTDRQFAVVKQKLLTYGRLWTEHNIDIRKHVNVLKYPLREIDRSHWIKLLEYNGEEVIGIRFPFNKKVIDRIEELRRLDTHNQKSHYYKDNVHCFPLTPKNIFEIVEIANRFSTKFAVQDDIINIYNQLLEYENNRNEYVPGVYDYEVCNIPDVAKEDLKNKLGECDKDTLSLYYDRRYLYGLQEFNQHLVNESIKQHSTIAQTIIKRDSAVVLLNNKSVNLNDLLSAIPEINRLPMLVTLNPNNAHDTLFAVHNVLKHIIPTEQMSVMFRKDSNDPINDYIKQQKLNNMVDKDTKVVYISSNKLPKPLLQANWNASCVLSFDSSKLTFNNVTHYVEQFDLRITYDEVAIGGLWDRRGRRYIRANM
jgi:hypothetical protein